jgi:hypothetical protein
VNSTLGNTSGPARYASAIAFCLALGFSQASVGDGLSKLKDVMNALSQGGDFSENFEAPATSNYTVVHAGKMFRTQRNTWSVESGSIDIVNTKVRTETIPFDGNQVIDMAGSPGAGVMSTSLRTKPGQPYEFAIRFGRNNGIGRTPARATVQIGGATPLLTQELVHDPGQVPFNQMLEYTGSFVADGTNTVLRISSLNAGSHGLTVDGISIKKAAAMSATAATLVSNVALKGVATQSSTAYDGPQYNGSGPASRANDGNTDGQYDHGSVSCTGQQLGWWQVKLDQPYALDTVNIWNRTDCCSTRINPFRVNVYLGTKLVTSVEHNVMPTSNNFAINLDGVVGDRVRVELERADWLQLAEVQVFGKPNQAVSNVNGDYTYLVPGFQGQGVATVTQIDNEVHIYTTWKPIGGGPHAEYKGKLVGDTITGEWYSLYKKQGWFKFVGQVRSNGDIDFSRSDDPINSNIKKVVLTKAR